MNRKGVLFRLPIQIQHPGRTLVCVHLPLVVSILSIFEFLSLLNCLQIFRHLLQRWLPLQLRLSLCLVLRFGFRHSLFCLLVSEFKLGCYLFSESLLIIPLLCRLGYRLVELASVILSEGYRRICHVLLRDGGVSTVGFVSDSQNYEVG